MALAWKGDFAQALKLLNGLPSEFSLSQGFESCFQSSQKAVVDQILHHQSLILLKQTGDQLYRGSSLNACLLEYEILFEKYPDSATLVSNISIVYLRLNQPQRCLDYIEVYEKLTCRWTNFISFQQGQIGSSAFLLP